MATANQSETCGIRAGGDINVQGNLLNVTNSLTSSTPVSSGRTKSPFRINIPTGTPRYEGRQDIFDKLGKHFEHLTFGTIVLKILTTIFNYFWQTPVSPWDRMVAIVGIGGIGKTELACQFANKFRGIYPNVAWIDAETEGDALNSFRSLAKSFGIVFDATKKADLDLVKSIYRHIDAHYREEVLLIFDNAIQLHSDENNFGILDYLPTESLANQLHPFIIITSQTPDWQKGITPFQLEELSEEESIAFFRSTFMISSSGCDEAFKKLHIQLQGYPLAMTLAASNIDFDSTKDSQAWLQEQIELFVERFEKEDSSILTQKINRNSASKYNKTLSTVWQLSFQRLKAEPNGVNALILLQAVSFFHVPINTDYLRFVFIECPYCPGTPDWMKYERLKESIRLLQKYHLVDCSFDTINYSDKLKVLQRNAEYTSEDLSSMFEEQVKSAKSFWCEMRVHRLVQLVVRLDMDCSVVLEDILRFLAFWAPLGNIFQLNVPAVEEAFGRTRLSTRASAFVGLLALQGNPSARRFIKTTTSPSEDPAATIWRVFQLDKSTETLNEEAIQVLRAFVRLSTSEKSLIDKRCFAKMALEMFHDRRIFPYVRDDGTSAPGIFLQSFTEIEGIVCELLSTGCSFTDVCSLPLLCLNKHRVNAATCTLLVGNKLIEDLTEANKVESQIARIREELNTYREFVYRGKNKSILYLEELREIFNSDDSWKRFESEVKSCGHDQLKLKQVFSSIFNKIWSATDKKSFSERDRLGYAFIDLDYLTYKFLRTPRSREILIPLMESFIEFLTKTEAEQLLVLQDPKGNVNNAVIWICSTWINFCIQKGCLSSNDLSDCVSRVRILTEIKTIPIDKIRDALQYFGYWNYLQPRHERTYSKFMEMHTESPVEEIRALVTYCKEIQHEIDLALKQMGLRT